MPINPWVVLMGETIKQAHLAQGSSHQALNDRTALIVQQVHFINNEQPNKLDGRSATPGVGSSRSWYLCQSRVPSGFARHDVPLLGCDNKHVGGHYFSLGQLHVACQLFD